MTAILWGPERASLVRPFYDDEPEPVSCGSQLFVTDDEGRPAGSLVCSLSADHTGAGLDVRHGLGLTRWTTAQAAESLAAYLATVPQCTERCQRPQYRGGLCRPCAAAELARDDIETESEAAA